MDESGFAHHSHRSHGWALRGKKIHDTIKGNNRKRTNLIMGYCRKTKAYLAPVLFEGACTAQLVDTWFEEHLIPELKPNSLVIMDNAAFHRKSTIKDILETHGHTLMPLPPYSPDFNPIEKVFAHLKKARQFSGQSLENIIMSYS